jgi:hypothetical protein
LLGAVGGPPGYLMPMSFNVSRRPRQKAGRQSEASRLRGSCRISAVGTRCLRTELVAPVPCPPPTPSACCGR